jgi:hypothetical protein
VGETRERELRGTGTAANGVRSFDYQYSKPPTRKRNSRSQPIGSAADDDAVILWFFTPGEIHAGFNVPVVFSIFFSDLPKKRGNDRMTAL